MDLKSDLRSDLDDFGMVGLVNEWVFKFYKFCRIPRRGPGVDFFTLVKELSFIIWN